MARAVAGLRPVTLIQGPSLPDGWQPNAWLVAALGCLREGDAVVSALNLNDGDCLALALAFMCNNTLSSLQLRGCSIGALGVAGLAAWLATNPVLTNLE